MGTHGCVGIGTPDSYKGVYNLQDSYPTKLGKDIWNEVQKHKGNLCDFAEKLLAHMTWEAFSLPNTPPAKESGFMTLENSNPLDIQWLYLLDIPSRKLIILFHKIIKMGCACCGQILPLVEKSQRKRLLNGGVDYGKYKAWYELVIELPIDEEEPIWEEVEEKGIYIEKRNIKAQRVRRIGSKE